MSERLIWMDLEMTGLDPARDAIVEIAMVVTEMNDYAALAECEFVIHQSEDVLSGSPEVVRDMHERSGLYTRVRASKMDLAQAEGDLLDVLGKHCRVREGILAGNSIWQDRRFLAAYLPAFEHYLHYRQVDVTTLKLLARTWFGEAGRFDKPGKTHTALADVHASIEELKFYRRLFGVPNT